MKVTKKFIIFITMILLGACHQQNTNDHQDDNLTVAIFNLDSHADDDELAEIMCGGWYSKTYQQSVTNPDKEYVIPLIFCAAAFFSFIVN